jgi:hypothetical protein
MTNLDITPEFDKRRTLIDCGGSHPEVNIAGDPHLVFTVAASFTRSRKVRLR